MKFTVIINSINRPKSLVQRAVKSVLEQIQAPSQLILIDQNKEPLQFDDVVAKNPLFKHIHNVVPSVSMARNSAPIPEDADWIVFCDDDGYWDANYFKELNGVISNEPQLEVIAGVILREDTREHYTVRQKVGSEIRNFASTKMLMGSNFAVKATVFLELGKFDVRFGAGSKSGSSEETDFCWKAYFAGKRIGYRPNLVVLHVPPFQENPKLAFSKSYRYGVGKSLLVKKWLFEERRPLVLIEWVEMFTLPFAQALLGLLKLQRGRVTAAIGAWLGRFDGFFFKKLEPR